VDPGAVSSDRPQRAGRRLGPIVALVAAATDAGILARTQPFTIASDAWCAVSFAAVVLFGLALRGRTTTPAAGPSSPLSARRALPWTLWFAAVLAFELINLSSAPRSQHPTLSSLLNQVMSWSPAKALVVLAWLVLGGWLVRR
jgi:hypothetical protein